MTSKTGEPRRDWLLAANGFLASGRARDKVRAWFHKLDRARNLQAGKDMLDKELRRVALMQADLSPALERFHIASVEELHIALALGDVGPSQVSRALHDHAQALLHGPAAASAAGRSDAAKAGTCARRGPVEPFHGPGCRQSAVAIGALLPAGTR